MDPARWQRLQELFEQAVALEPAARAPWLQRLEDEDAELADALNRLLTADEQTAGRRISERIERFAASSPPPGELEAGRQVGPYTVDRLLGHGGMGRVYLAHRSDRAYRQQVVVKVVQAAPGERLIRLFERERQILADLNHPNIARLLDGGTLEEGTPYLVMEYVEGTDLISWCESHQTSLFQRLRLFLEVCQAVRYAHAQLVVHRDIKPANVLVDPTGRVRLLDFGIATLLTTDDGSPTPGIPATGNREETLSSALLTPAHASPEQRRGEAVTTASDIYSLGLLLYRLICGRESDSGLGGDDITAPPSKVLAASGRKRLAWRVAGDLDAIIIRALAEAPDQRHATVAELAAELQRFLDLRPVHSRATPAAHRLALFTRRNPALSAVLGGAVSLSVGFAIGLSWLVVQLGHERDQALAARSTTDHVAGFMVDLFAAADPRQHLGEPPGVRELLDRGAARIEELESPPDLTATLLSRMAEAYRHIGATEQADSLLDRALELAGLTRSLRVDLQLEQADLWREAGRTQEAEARLTRLIETLEASPTTPNALASAYNNLALVLETLELPEQAEQWVRQALAVSLPDTRDSRIDRLTFSNNLALILSGQDRHDEAIELLEQIIEEKIEVLGQRHPSVLVSQHNLAYAYRLTGRLTETVALLEKLRAANADIHGQFSLAVAKSDNELANAWHDMGNYQQAETAYRRSYEYFEQHPQADSSIHAFVANNLASLLEDQGDLAEAERWFDRSVALRTRMFPSDSLPYLRGLMNRVRVQIQLGRLQPADADLHRIEHALETQHPDQTDRRFRARLLRAEWHAASGQIKQARDTLAGIDPEFIDAQAPDSKWARRLSKLRDAVR